MDSTNTRLRTSTKRLVAALVQTGLLASMLSIPAPTLASEAAPDGADLAAVRQQLADQARALTEQQRQLAEDMKKLEAHKRALDDSQRRLDALQQQLGMAHGGTAPANLGEAAGPPMRPD